MNQPDRRVAPRVSFDAAELPELIVGQEHYVVLDCSELGLRLMVHGPRAPAVGSMVDGILRFRAGVEAPVAGAVVWTITSATDASVHQAGIVLNRMRLPAELLSELQEDGGDPAPPLAPEGAA